MSISTPTQQQSVTCVCAYTTFTNNHCSTKVDIPSFLSRMLASKRQHMELDCADGSTCSLPGSCQSGSQGHLMCPCQQWDWHVLSPSMGVKAVHMQLIGDVWDEALHVASAGLWTPCVLLDSYQIHSELQITTHKTPHNTQHTPWVSTTTLFHHAA